MPLSNDKIMVAESCHQRSIILPHALKTTYIMYEAVGIFDISVACG